MRRIRPWLCMLALVTPLVLGAVLGALAPGWSQQAEITTNRIGQADTARPIVIDGGSGATVGVAIGATGAPIRSLTRYIVSLTPGSQSANTCAPQSLTVTGVAVGDIVLGLQHPATGNATGYGSAWVSAANTIAQTVCNPTAGALTPAAGAFVYWVLR